MRRLLVPLAVLGLALTAGCSDQETRDAGAEAPAGATTTTAAADRNQKQQQAENLVADCMKAQGFKYVPQVPADLRHDSGRFAGGLSVLEPEAEVRKFRQKYGFGVFGRLVHPNDPAVAIQGPDPAGSPNDTIRGGLDAARRKAYDAALQGTVTEFKGSDAEVERKQKAEVAAGKKLGCSREAYVKVFGDTESNAPAEQAREREYAAFQTDPQVVAAAQKWADCLRGQGYKVSSARPGEIDLAMASAAVDGKLPAGPEEDSGLPVPESDTMTAAVGGSASIAPAEAQAGLKREIKAALADLDCRTDYATLVRTKYAKVLLAHDGQG